MKQPSASAVKNLNEDPGWVPRWTAPFIIFAVLIYVALSIFKDSPETESKRPNEMHVRSMISQPVFYPSYLGEKQPETQFPLVPVGESTNVIFYADLNSERTLMGFGPLEMKVVQIETSTPSICNIESKFGAIRGIRPGDCVVTGSLPATKNTASASLTIHIKIVQSKVKSS